MRAIFGIGLALAFAGVAAGEDKKDEKIDGKLLVGKWKQVEPKDSKVTVEYTADGKLTGTLIFLDKTFKVIGTYKVEGNKILQTARFEDEKDERKTTLILSKLAEDVFEGELDGKKFTFKRVKQK